MFKSDLCVQRPFEAPAFMEVKATSYNISNPPGKYKLWQAKIQINQYDCQ